MAVRIEFGEVFKGGDGWRFHTIAGNYKTLAWGEGYENRGDALDTLIAHMPNGSRVVVRTGDDSIDHVVIVGGLGELEPNETVNLDAITKGAR